MPAGEAGILEGHTSDIVNVSNTKTIYNLRCLQQCLSVGAC